jgi:tetratricopeptide (TPR) repeat protein
MPSAFAQKNCLEHSKELFNDKDYAPAEDILKACLRQRPGNTDVLISLGGVQMILGKFNDAENNFKAAARGLEPKSPYIAYVNSRLGDIAMRKPDLKAAAFFYDAALKAESANINALVGKGVIEEKLGRTEEAVASFKKALAVDFTNIVARERLIAMEPDILSYEEVLAVMRERNIIDPAAEKFTDEEEDLLRKMIQAEKDKGIEYLASKFNGKIPTGFIVERDAGKVYVRKMLTLTGYNELLSRLSGDARDFFLAKNIQPGQVFELKDFDGKMVFDETGLLTDEGLAVYTKGLRGFKAYILPGELLTSTQKEIDAMAQYYSKKGYKEISMHEFHYLLRHTQCTEETLVKDVGMRVLNISADIMRVFVVAVGEKIPDILPWGYVLDYRQRDYESKQNGGTPVQSKSPFGLGGGVELKLCGKDGKLLGDSLQDLARQGKENAAARRR